MKAIAIKNLKSLKDTGFVDLKPINLIVGKNSSGKSTLTRFLPLLKQSVETQTRGPILWYGRLVDFGSFKNALRRSTEKDEISFSFKIDVETKEYSNVLFYNKNLEKFEIVLTLDVTLLDGLTSTKYCRIEGWGHDIECEFSHEELVDLKINKFSVLSWIRKKNIRVDQKSLVPELRFSQEAYNEMRRMMIDAFQDTLPTEFVIPPVLNPIVRDGTIKILEIIKKYLHGNTSEMKKSMTAFNIEFGTQRSILESVRGASQGSYWRKKTQALEENHEDLGQIVKAVVLRQIPQIIHLLNENLEESLLRVNYSAPLRAIAERYYRRQDLAIEEIDPKGSNLPMFLQSLSQNEKEQFEVWTKENLGFTISSSPPDENLSIKIREENSSESFNLADMGFGYSQIIPVVTQIWKGLFKDEKESDKSWGSIFVIEQPELHLHPALQAKVADLIVRMIRTAKEGEKNIKFIVETHSEAIVNRIGNRVASKEDGLHIQAQDVQVLLFEAQTPNDSRLRIASFDENGFLDSEWPFGFFEPDMI